MRIGATKIIAAAVLACLLPVASLAGLVPYNQNFEGMILANPFALAEDNWLVYGNVWDTEGTYLYGYGPFDAPNEGFGFSQLASGEGGPEQGDLQLVVYSDYNNEDHGLGYLIESNVYQEWTIEGSDIGDTWAFQFDAKLGNLEGSSTAAAFIKTLDPGAGYALTNFISLDMTNTPVLWSTYIITIDIDQSLNGQILQIGFMNHATNYEGSAVFYDNIDLRIWDGSDVPSGALAARAELRQNYPNPFNPATKIDFVLERSGFVELTVFDLAGRLVTTLRQGELVAGPHSVTWNGTTAAGLPAAAGQYRYVLRTPTGQVSRSMTLLK